MSENSRRSLTVWGDRFGYAGIATITLGGVCGVLWIVLAIWMLVMSADPPPYPPPYPFLLAVTGSLFAIGLGLQMVAAGLEKARNLIRARGGEN